MFSTDTLDSLALTVGNTNEKLEAGQHDVFPYWLKKTRENGPKIVTRILILGGMVGLCVKRSPLAKVTLVRFPARRAIM